MKRVIIIGMGFGGLRAARGLAGKGVEVVVVDRRNFHLFQPLLYQVATASLEPEAIAYPIRAAIRDWKGIDFRLGEVTGVDFEKRQVQMQDDVLPYDYLVLAAGGATHYFGMKSIETYSFDLKSLEQSESLRNHIIESFERAAIETDPEKRRALLTFVITGGGPAGVEFAGALKELIDHELSRDFPTLDMAESKVILLEGRDALLAFLPESQRLYTKKRLEDMGIEVHFNTQVSGAEPGKVLLGDGSCIPACTIVWTAGVQASPLAAELGLPRGANGRIRVREDLSIEEHPEVFAIGDIAFLEQDGRPLPMVAPVAMQGGSYVAKAILTRIKGRPSRPFRYHDKGNMATIGRSSAVAYTFGMKYSGFIAWVLWLFLHLMYLVGFRNRLVVLINWGFYYFHRAMQVRIISESTPRGGKS